MLINWSLFLSIKKKLSDAIEKEVVKKDVQEELVKKVNTIDTNKFVKKADYIVKINEIKDKIPSITGLATTASRNAVENKIAKVSD